MRRLDSRRRFPAAFQFTSSVCRARKEPGPWKRTPGEEGCILSMPSRRAPVKVYPELSILPQHKRLITAPGIPASVATARRYRSIDTKAALRSSTSATTPTTGSLGRLGRSSASGPSDLLTKRTRCHPTSAQRRRGPHVAAPRRPDLPGHFSCREAPGVGNRFRPTEDPRGGLAGPFPSGVLV